MEEFNIIGCKWHITFIFQHLGSVFLFSFFLIFFLFLSLFSFSIGSEKNTTFYFLFPSNQNHFMLVGIDFDIIHVSQICKCFLFISNEFCATVSNNFSGNFCRLFEFLFCYTTSPINFWDDEMICIFLSTEVQQ